MHPNLHAYKTTLFLLQRRYEHTAEFLLRVCPDPVIQWYKDSASPVGQLWAEAFERVTEFLKDNSDEKITISDFLKEHAGIRI